VGNQEVAERFGEESQGSLQVIERLAQILFLFTPKRREIRVADVAQELGLQRPTAHRYLTSLAQIGLLRRNDAGGGYILGPLAIRVGSLALNGVSVVELAGHVMQPLAEEVHQTAVLSLWAGLGPVVVRVCEDNSRFALVTVRVGQPLSVASAQSQVFLAYLPDRSLVRRLISQLPAAQAHQLEDDIERVRDCGLAIQEWPASGLRVLAVPVCDGTGGIAAVMALVGTAASIPADPASGFATALKEAARRLSASLGHVFSAPESLAVRVKV
jgi:DNA-binding IclR family transcriptional regulator